MREEKGTGANTGTTIGGCIEELKVKPPGEIGGGWPPKPDDLQHNP